jgi:Ca2+-transporting ATPase
MAVSNWHQLDAVDALRQLNTDASSGLSEAQAAERLAKLGPNELVERGSRSPWAILGEQLSATMVVVLIVAAVISAALGEYKDALAIMAIVFLNAVLGFVQEYKAERAIAALKRLAVPRVKVRRDGRIQEIAARKLVPGDILLLEAGNLVPADCRLLESVNLRTEEAALTGESIPVEKETRPQVRADLSIADRRNMAYMGTIVAYGRGTGLVTETGMATELGRIAAMIQTVAREATPLQRRLDQLGARLALVALVIVGFVFLAGLLQEGDLKLLFLTAVSLAVAAVPEGLPAVVTIALALGAQRMLKRGALIRKLPAVETLGSVTVICADKTGTLTENRMTVTVLDVAGHRLDLTERLSRSAPVFEPDEIRALVSAGPSGLALFLAGGALCNDAFLESKKNGPGRFRAVGDPTEGALVVAAARFGLWKEELAERLPRLAEVPFETERKRMTTFHEIPTPPNTAMPESLEALSRWLRDGQSARYIAFTKGAVESLIGICTGVWVGERAEPLTESWIQSISASHDQLAQQGMRVLGVAFRPLDSLPENGGLERLEQDLIFVGLAGMLDPPRPEAKEAVLICKKAGIRPVMVTGDHPLTAMHIARELGIEEKGPILTGMDLDRIGHQELAGMLDDVSVYARVSPEHKLKIVQLLQQRGHIVAMTGDGVNDAPALKRADIGVAMGLAGTDVAKEASDMVLLDDNFATIVAAVKEGRVIYANIRKFIKYLLATNSGELWVMLLAPFLGMPLPLLPLQILWINLVSDGLPALALALEPAERGAMERPPYSPRESFFSRGMGREVIWMGFLMGLVSLGIGYWYWVADNLAWQTALFTTLALSQMGNVLAIRSDEDSLWRIGLLSNRPLLGAVASTVVLQLAVVYVSFFNVIFATIALPPGDLILCLALSSVVFWAVEMHKWLKRKNRGGEP